MLYESGIVGEELTHNEDRRMIEFGIGLTDLVKRPTRSEEELSREEFGEGRMMLSQKFEQFAPRIVAFNGKTAYEKFSQRSGVFGKQQENIYGAMVFILPPTSGKQATVRGTKLRYFRQLAKLLDETKAR